MKKVIFVIAVILVALFTGAMGIKYAINPNDRSERDAVEISNIEIQNSIIEHSQENALISTDEALHESEEEKSSLVETEDDVEEQPQILRFVDVFGEEYQTEIIQDVPQSDFLKSNFVHDGEKLSYEDDKYYSRLGVDVSHHQGHIDWEKVKASGYDFAFIRIGYRGYGKAGTLNLDKRFEENIEAAHNAGLDVGVYFFSQAINLEEAKEEAQFVIEHLKNYKLELPVVYDPESILDDEARTDDVSGEQFTENTILFCTMISEAGYEPMIYSNMLWEAFQFEMTELSDYPFWYADYELEPQTPYRYVFWQYTNEGYVDGINGRTDLDIELVER